MDLYDELTAVVDALERAVVDYALCGGIAVAIHGYPRLTRDIDLLVSGEQFEAALATLRPLGFYLKAGMMTFDRGTATERRVQRVTKVEAGDHLTIDLVLTEPSLRGVWGGREVYAWNGRQVRVVSRDGLVQMKRMAGRPKDLLDLQQLGSGDDGKRADHAG